MKRSRENDFEEDNLAIDERLKDELIEYSNIIIKFMNNIKDIVELYNSFSKLVYKQYNLFIINYKSLNYICNYKYTDLEKEKISYDAILIIYKLYMNIKWSSVVILPIVKSLHYIIEDNKIDEDKNEIIDKIFKYNIHNHLNNILSDQSINNIYNPNIYFILYSLIKYKNLNNDNNEKREKWMNENLNNILIDNILRDNIQERSLKSSLILMQSIISINVYNNVFLDYLNNILPDQLTLQLVKLTDHKNLDIVYLSFVILKYRSTCCIKHRMLLYRFGIMDKLNKYLKQDIRKDINIILLEILTNMTFNNNYIRKIIHDNNYIKIIIKYLDSRSLDVQYHTVVLLRNISVYSPSRLEIMKYNGVEKIIKLLYIPIFKLYIQTTAALWNLASNNQIKYYIKFYRGTLSQIKELRHISFNYRNNELYRNSTGLYNVLISD